MELTSRRRRRPRSALRTAGLLAGSLGAIAAAGLMGVAPAHAALDETPTGVPTLTFDGGCLLGLGLSAWSHPDKTTMTVTTRGSIRFVNSLNRDAVLDFGDVAYDVARGEARTFKIHKTVDVTMRPDCIVPGIIPDYRSTKITTVPAPETRVPPATGPNQPARPGGGAAVPPRTGPDTGQRPADLSDPIARGAVPPGDDNRPADPGEEQVAPPAGPPQDPSGPGAKPIAVEPVGPSRPVGDSATNLLALIAAVCLVGVGAAGIRAVLAQRASTHRASRVVAT